MTDDNKLGGFDFAIQQIKAGKRMARVGWNGKNMFVFSCRVACSK